MKSKLVILSLLLAGAAVTATAQTKERFYSEKAGDNIFISVGVGAQVRTADENMDNFGDAINPKVTLSVGKWFTPIWGIRGQVTGWETNLITDYNHGTVSGTGANQEKVYGPDTREFDKNYISLHADALLNLSNLIAGYNPDRLFTLSVFGGPGFNIVRGYKNGTQEEYTDATNTTWTRQYKDKGIRALINGSVGLLGQFNVSQYWDIFIEARGEVGAAPYTRICRSYTDGAIALTAGATYTFGGKKFVTCGAKVDNTDLNNTINRMRQQISDLEDELAAAKRNTGTKAEVKEVVKEVVESGRRAVFFQIGKSVIDDYNRIHVKLAAEIIKKSGKKYTVAGYADKATGSAGFNQKLSERRAQAVYDALIKEGVSSDQLEYKGFGGTANMWDRDKLNRVVILE